MIASSITVVEPHADDAFLSLGTHIEEWIKDGVKVRIVTVFSGTRKRAADAEAYAKAVGAEWLGLGYVEGEPLPEEPLPIGAPPGSLVLVPLGVTHAEHVLVRKAVEADSYQVKVLYYLDQPYALTQANGPLISTLMYGRPVMSYRKPGARKFRHIKLFKDQAKFYHYNPPEKLIQMCELLVGGPP